MKQIHVGIILLAYNSLIFADVFKIVNSTSGQVSVMLKTSTQTLTISANPNENQFINDINNSDYTFSTINYDHNPIDKLVITRAASNVPQFIYYNNEVLMDQKNNPIGLYHMNNHDNGIMRIAQDHVMIDNYIYNLADMSSILGRINLLRAQLTIDNMLSSENQLSELQSDCKLIQEGTSSSQVQIMMIQGSITALKNDIDTMKSLQSMLTIIQKLQDSLQLGDVSETDKQVQGYRVGTHTAEVQSQVQALAVDMQTLLQGHSSKPIALQIQVVKNALQRLQQRSNSLARVQAGANLEELISDGQQQQNEIALNNFQLSNNIGIGA